MSLGCCEGLWAAVCVSGLLRGALGCCLCSMLEQEEHELVVGGQTPPLTCTAETPSPHAPVPCNVMGLWASLLGGESAAPCRLTSQRAEQEQAFPRTHQLRVMRLTQDAAWVLSPLPSWAHGCPRGAGLYSFKFCPSEVANAGHSTASREPCVTETCALQCFLLFSSSCLS